ncbi:MAG: PAS domain S-box protein [Desulfobacterales bacterium]
MPDLVEKITEMVQKGHSCQAEERYRALSEASFEAIFISENGICFDANQTACEMFGYEHDELMGIFGADIMASQSRAQVKQHILAGYELPYEAVGLKKDGSTFHIQIRGRMMTYGGKRVRVTVIQDIDQSKRMIDALALSESRFRTLVERAPMGFSIMDANQAFEYFNPEFTQILGYTLEDLPDKRTWFEKAYPDPQYRNMARTIWEEDSRIGATTGELARRTFTIQAKDGRQKAVRFSNVALPQGKQLLSYEDVTLQAEAERALKESRQTVQALIDANPETELLIDTAGRVLALNETAARWLKRPRDEILGRNLFDLFPAKVARSRRAYLAQAIDSAQAVRFEDLCVDHYLRTRLTPLFDDQGRVVKVAIFSLDLTRQQQAEIALAESEAQNRRLLDSVLEAIFVLDTETLVFEDVNQAALDLFGYTRAEFLQLQVEEISDEKEKTRKTIRQTVNGSIAKTHVPLRYFRKKDGSIFPGELLATRFESAGKLNIIGSVRDITTRMVALEALHQREKQLSESEQQLRRLTSSLLTAHEEERRRIAYVLHDDLGQELATLNFRLSALERGLKRQSVEGVAECRGIRRQVGALAENVRRLSRGMSPTVLENLGLTSALKWLLKDFSQFSGVAVEEKIDDIDEQFSTESQTIIYRIFQEALTNTRKHAEASRVDVEIERQGSAVRFYLHDNGRGFDSRDDGSDACQVKGLGLTTMEERARILGGPLKRTSKPGHGTTIEFTVPRGAKESCP